MPGAAIIASRTAPLAAWPRYSVPSRPRARPRKAEGRFRRLRHHAAVIAAQRLQGIWLPSPLRAPRFSHQIVTYIRGVPEGSDARGSRSDTQTLYRARPAYGALAR